MRSLAARTQAVVLGMIAAVALTAPSGAHAAYGDAPVIHSAQAVGITTTSASLQASTTPNQNFFAAQFSYCKVGLCPEGTVELPLIEQSLTGGDEETDPGLSPQSLTMPLTGLSPSTDYQVTLAVSTDTWDGSDEHPATVKTFTFRTADPEIPVTPVGPSVQTGTVTGVTANAATLNGVVVPGTTGAISDRTVTYFEWGPVGGGYPNTTPHEELPADSNQYTVSAGLSGLPSSSSFQARLIAERGGTRKVGAPVQFTTKLAPNCPSGTEFQTAKLGRVQAVGCFRSAGNVWVASSDVRLNGVLLEPAGGKQVDPPQIGCGSSPACSGLLDDLGKGNKLYLAKNAGRLGTTGKWRMSAGPMEGLYKGRLDVSNVDWNADKPLMSLGADASVDLLDFPLAGKFTFTAHEDGSSRLGLLVGMPVALGGVTGDTAVKINPGGDMSFDRIEIEVGELPVKKVTLGGLRFLYDRTEDVWEGAATVTVPSPSAIRVGVSVRVKNGKFNEFAGSLDNLNQHIAYGIYLQKVGVLFGLDPIRFGGSMGISAGPKIAGISAIGVDGEFLFNMQERDEKQPNGTWVSYPPSLQLGGEVSVFTIPVREASIEVFFTNFAWVEADFGIGYSFEWNGMEVFGLDGTLGGSLKHDAIDIWGEGGLTVFDFDVAGAKAILNNDGVAACGHAAGFGIGGYFVWRTGEPEDVWYCDLTKLRADLAKSSTLASDGRIPVAVPVGEDQAAVRFVGENGQAPQVRLYGPDGRVIETPGPGVGNASDETKNWLSFRDELHGNTDVLLADTGEGEWSYEPMPGSAGVAEVQTAGELPKAKVRASVTRVKRTSGKRRGKKARSGGKADARYRLSWKLRRIAGQRVTFSVEGQGVPPRVLTRTGKAKGSITFRPYPMPERGRRIIATVEQDGKPRARMSVARFTAPALPKANRVKRLRASSKGKGKRKRVVVRWAKLAGAGSYRAFAHDRDGSIDFRETKRPRLVLRGKEARGLRTAVVQPVSVTLEPGKKSRVRIRAKSGNRKTKR